MRTIEELKSVNQEVSEWARDAGKQLMRDRRERGNRPNLKLPAGPETEADRTKSRATVTRRYYLSRLWKLVLQRRVFQALYVQGFSRKTEEQKVLYCRVTAAVEDQIGAMEHSELECDYWLSLKINGATARNIFNGFVRDAQALELAPTATPAAERQAA